MNKLTDIEYWESAQGLPCIDLDENNIIKKWIENSVDIKQIETCIEIGCYPGRYLSIFGDKGVQVNGIDYLPGVLRLKNLCKEKGYKTGNFYCLDFHKDSIEDKFDCVYSLGFVEHFNDWEVVFRKHVDLLSKDGILIIEVPNFCGWLQKVPRLIFDRENYLRHNIESMNLGRWIQLLNDNDLEILRADYFGGYMLWFEKDCGPIESLIRRSALRFLGVLRSIIYLGVDEHPAFSGALGVIARRRS